MTKLAKVLDASAGMDEDQFKETIAQNSLFPGAHNSDLFLASDFEDEDDDDEFEEEEEDLFDEDELVEEESYEEDFDFDEDEGEDDEDEDAGTYN